MYSDPIPLVITSIPIIIQSAKPSAFYLTVTRTPFITHRIEYQQPANGATFTNRCVCINNGQCLYRWINF